MSDDIAARLAEMSARFAARAGEYRAQLAEADRAGNRDAVTSLAHRLAGISAMFGQGAIGDAALALEECAERGDDYAGELAALDGLLAALEAANG